MIQLKNFKLVCVSLLLAVATSTSSTSVRADQRTRLAIVVAKASPITGLSFNELKRLYLGSIVTGPKGTSLIAVNQSKDSPDRLGFGQSVLNMSPDQLGRYWIDRKIRGQSGPPKSLETPEQVRKAVAHNPDAVGYLRVNELGPDVKAIPIDGKDVKTPGYRIEF